MNTPNSPIGDAASAPIVGPQGKVLAQFLGMQYVDKLPDPSPPRNPVRGDFDRIAGSWGRQFLTVPIGGDDSHVVVATADPLNVEAIDQLRVCYERPIKVLVTSPEEVTKAINHIRTSLMSDRSSNLADSDSKDDRDDASGKLRFDKQLEMVAA